MPSGKVGPQIAWGLGAKKPGMPDMMVDRLASELPKIDDGQSWSSDAFAADAVPEFAQPGDAVGRLVAGNERAVDGADRRADHPVGLDAAFHQRLVDAGLVGAEGAAALQHQDHLFLDGAFLGRRSRGLRRRRRNRGHGIHGRTPQ